MNSSRFILTVNTGFCMVWVVIANQSCKCSFFLIPLLPVRLDQVVCTISADTEELEPILNYIKPSSEWTVHIIRFYMIFWRVYFWRFKSSQEIIGIFGNRHSLKSRYDRFEIFSFKEFLQFIELFPCFYKFYLFVQYIFVFYLKKKLNDQNQSNIDCKKFSKKWSKTNKRNSLFCNWVRT